MLDRLVVTIAVELKDSSYKEAIAELSQKMSEFENPPFDIQKAEHHYVFDGMGFNTGVNATLNLIFFNDLSPGSVAIYYPNVKKFLENLTAQTYKLIAISNTTCHFTEYKK